MRQTENRKGGSTLTEIIISALAVLLMGKAIQLAFKITWGVAKVIATVLLVVAIPIFIVCLIFAGGFLLLLPLALIAGAIGILKLCA